MAETRDLTINIRAKTDTDKAFDRIQKKIDKFNRSLKKANRSIERENKRLIREQEKLLDSITQTAKRTSLVVGASILATIKVYADYESALIKVVKSSKVADDGVLKFSKDLEIATDALAKLIPNKTPVQLLKISQLAAQLGVKGVKNITKFTETFAKLEIATNLAGEQAVLDFKTFAGLTKEPIENVDKLASVIVDLGNDLNVTESQILANAIEVAKAVQQYKLSTSAVLAYAGIMKLSGTEAEVAGTTILSVFIKINEAIAAGGEELELLQDILGLTGQQIKQTFEDDPEEGLRLFIEGLNGVLKSGGDVVGILRQLGLADKRLLKNIPALTGNYEILEKALDSAAKQYEINTALEKEFERQTKTLTSHFGFFKNAVLTLSKGIGSEYAPSIKGALKATTKFINKIIESEGAIESIAKILKQIFGYSGLIVGIGLVTKSMGKLSKAIVSFKTIAKSATITNKAFWSSLFFPALAGVAAYKITREALNFLEKKFFTLKTAEEAYTKSSEKLLKLQKQRTKEEENLGRLGGTLDNVIQNRINKIDEQIIKEEQLRNQLKKTVDFRTGLKEKKEKEEKEKEEKEEKEEKKDEDIGGSALVERLKAEQEEIKKIKENFKAEQDELKEEERQTKLDLDIEQKEADLERIKEFYESEKALGKKASADELKRIIDTKKKEIGVQKKAAEEIIKIKAETRKIIKEGAWDLAGQLVAASGASAKTIFAIQKALGIAQILINGHMAAILAMATVPPPAGEVLGAARLTKAYVSAAFVGATSALTFATGFAGGGEVRGIGNKDTVPAMLTPGEFVVPAPQADQFKQVMAREQNIQQGTSEENSGGNMNVTIGLSDDAKEFGFAITDIQHENQILGVSR